MRCKMCGDKINFYHLSPQNVTKIKGGYICDNCLTNLALYNNDDLRKYNISKIRKIREVSYKFNWKYEHSVYKYKRFMFNDNALEIGQTVFDLNYIKKVSLYFEPTYVVDDEHAKGYLSLKIEFSNGISYSDVINLEKCVFKYNFKSKKRIVCSGFPSGLYNAVEKLNHCLEKGEDCLYHREFFRKCMETDEPNKYRQRNEQAQQNNKQKSSQNNKQTNNSQRNNGLTMEQAKKLFCVSENYDLITIKKRRNVLLKKFHPDAGGSKEKCMVVNLAYDMLKKNC